VRHLKSSLFRSQPQKPTEFCNTFPLDPSVGLDAIRDVAIAGVDDAPALNKEIVPEFLAAEKLDPIYRDPRARVLSVRAR